MKTFFLGIFENEISTFVFLDLYNEVKESDLKYKTVDNEAAENFIKISTRKHRKTAEMISREFIIPHQKFENYFSKRKIEIVIKLAPQIPSQIDTFDCGVFLLQFAKYV